jgi:hypothetical protein
LSRFNSKLDHPIIKMKQAHGAIGMILENTSINGVKLKVEKK